MWEHRHVRALRSPYKKIRSTSQIRRSCSEESDIDWRGRWTRRTQRRLNRDSQGPYLAKYHIGFEVELGLAPYKRVPTRKALCFMLLRYVLVARIQHQEGMVLG